jgi:Tfp pilus assembly protein PilN
MTALFDWLRTHGVAAWPALSLVLILVLRTRTPEAWVALGERQPRLQGLIRALRAAGLDPVKLVAGLAQLVTGRAPVDPREAELSQLRTELAALQRRVSESHAVTQPQGLAHPAQIFAPVFDPSARQTIAPEVAAQLPRDSQRDSQRGSTSLSAAIVAVALIGIVGAVGVALSGCPRMPPVSGCQPEAQTCIGDAPHVCSASQRWHRAGDLSCAAVGGVCTVMGGRALCAPVADAGADVGDVE